MDIVSIIERVISLGQQVAERLEAHKEAVESLSKLEKILIVLKDMFKKMTDANVDKAYIINIKDTLERTQKVYVKCVGDLTIKENKSFSGKFKKVVGIYKAPNILADIQKTIIDVERDLSITDKALSIYQRSQTASTSTIVSTTTSTITSTSSSTNIISSELKDALANTIEELVTRLKSDCQQLQEKLERCTLSTEPFFFEGLGRDNPEAISFWKERFRSAELCISSVAPYENMYVSWARFIHELEVTFQLRNIPTATKEKYFGSIDDIRRYGNRYYIDSTETRNLKDIRPLWIPSLRKALDPLHKGYIKPHDYLNFLGEDSLSNKLRQVVLDSCGYGIFVECQRTSSDISLPKEIESPAHSVGWMSACQIVSVPTSTELGIFIYDKSSEQHFSNLIENIIYPKNDIWVYVRYLQTGQIEKKLISKNVRMLGGLRTGISISILENLENGSSAWSENLSIVELKACAGGRYIVTAGSGDKAIVFKTKQQTDFNGRAIQSDQLDALTDLPECNYCILGPSTVFTQEPKVGEKIQIHVDGSWFDVKVTEVNGDYVKHVAWSHTPPNSPTEDTEKYEDTENGEDEKGDDTKDDDSEGGSLGGFTEDQLLEQEKSPEKLWCPWSKGITSWDIRPYRCLHVGDLVEAPVTYPDYLFRYHGLEESQLYLPARIMDVQDDQYLIKFSPAVSAYAWWPGRTSSDEFPREPGSKETVKNPFDGIQVIMSMDRVRPYAVDPNPVLGTQSIRPHSWSAFQGVQFADLQQIDDDILWK
ncbi:17280_t:CDS:2 [Funneliformis geosporum]|uniref:16987_t:CDS:1 n=1 Tax=Funneliformis geosporum TaxID=1117311 RepID=A0A9W4WPN4_9GLOM|nr:17280_t:CDS:2 [Funneliformis geosporum]CAI2177654.1 16987_t:CDS:2 [Funneliformis geosporum]